MLRKLFFHLVKDLKQRNKFWVPIQIPCNSLCCSTRVFVCFYLLLKRSIPQHLDQWHRLEPANKVETTATPDLLWQAQNYATHQHSKSSVDAMERWQSNVQCTNLQRHQDKQPWRTFQIHSLELVLCKRGELDVLKRRRVTGTWSKQRKINHLGTMVVLVTLKYTFGNVMCYHDIIVFFVLCVI